MDSTPLVMLGETTSNFLTSLVTSSNNILSSIIAFYPSWLLVALLAIGTGWLAFKLFGLLSRFFNRTSAKKVAIA